MNRKEARLCAGLSISQVASAIGVKPQAVTQWENGETNPTPEKIPKLAGLYKMEPIEFLRLETESGGER